MTSDKTKLVSVGFCDLLTICFVVLKLCKVITWSWVWVLAPLWIPIAIALVLGILYIIFDKKENTK